MKLLALLCLLSLPATAEVLKRPKNIEGFLLFDHTGQPVTQSSLKGKPTLIFPFFTRCPDVCPSTAWMLSVVKKQVPDINVVLVSIDPADTPAMLKAYADQFGVITTAYASDTATLLHSLGAHKMHTDAPLTTHPAAIYGLNSQGKWVAYWRYPADVAKLISELRTIQ